MDGWMASARARRRPGPGRATVRLTGAVQSWCGACKRLGPEFAASEAVRALASRFVMINVLDDEEPTEAAYKPGTRGATFGVGTDRAA